MTDLAASPMPHPFKQVAIVVRDLHAAARAWSAEMGVGPWNGWRLDPSRLEDMTYRGEPAEFAFLHALAWKADMQFELVQPLEGPSIFTDHLDEHGEGLHHLGAYVPDHAAAVADLRARGFTPLQSARGFGATGDGAFAYFTSDHPLAAIVELIEAPSVRREPDFVIG